MKILGGVSLTHTALLYIPCLFFLMCFMYLFIRGGKAEALMSQLSDVDGETGEKPAWVEKADSGGSGGGGCVSERLRFKGDWRLLIVIVKYSSSNQINSRIIPLPWKPRQPPAVIGGLLPRSVMIEWSQQLDNVITVYPMYCDILKTF